MDNARRKVKLIKPHVNQEHIIKTRKRYNVLKCGRRFGKTSLTQYLAAETTLNGQYIGIWQPTYKDLHNVWNELKYTLHPITESKNEQVKQLILITGGMIEMWSMEDPNAGRGRKYHRIIIDEAEKSRNLKEIWEQTIRGTLADYQGDAYFFSTPKFGKTYFKELSKKSDDKWAAWKFTTLDNPFISKEEVEEIKLTVPPKVFECEFLAEDVDNVIENGFMYADVVKSSQVVELVRTQPIYISFDFNVSPCTAIIGQKTDKYRIVHNILGEARQSRSALQDVCLQINEYLGDMPRYLLRITGDASGKSGSADRIVNSSFYDTICRELKVFPKQVIIRKANIPHVFSQEIINHFFRNVNIELCNVDALIDDINCAYMENESLDKAKKEYGLHLFDCFRYLIDLWACYHNAAWLKRGEEIKNRIKYLK